MPPQNPPRLLLWEDCKWSLGKLWITSAAVFFGAMLFLSLNGRFEITTPEGVDPDLKELAKAFPEPTKTAWKWAMNAVLPSISLIIGALLSNLGAPAAEAKMVESRQFRLAYAVSGFYLGALFVLLVASLAINQLPVKTLDSSSIWLVSIQGICSTVLSVFYVRAASAPSAPPAKSD